MTISGRHRSADHGRVRTTGDNNRSPILPSSCNLPLLQQHLRMLMEPIPLGEIKERRDTAEEVPPRMQCHPLHTSSAWLCHVHCLRLETQTTASMILDQQCIRRCPSKESQHAGQGIRLSTVAMSKRHTQLEVAPQSQQYTGPIPFDTTHATQVIATKRPPTRPTSSRGLNT